MIDWNGPNLLKTDVLQPTAWVMRHNPELHYRALFSRNLKASILACLAVDPDTERNESALARACGVTRKAPR